MQDICPLFNRYTLLLSCICSYIVDICILHKNTQFIVHILLKNTKLPKTGNFHLQFNQNNGILFT